MQINRLNCNNNNNNSTGIELFSNLPTAIRCLNHDIKMFKSVLKEYLLLHSCFIEEFTLIKNSHLWWWFSDVIILVSFCIIRDVCKYVNSCSNFVFIFLFETCTVFVLLYVPNPWLRPLECNYILFCSAVWYTPYSRAAPLSPETYSLY